MAELARVGLDDELITVRELADIQLVELWLHGRGPHTQRAYRADVDRFLAFVAKPLPAVTRGDLQAFADTLEQQDLGPSSRVRTLAAIKSLLAFGQRTGYRPLNVGAALKLRPKKDKIAERILYRHAIELYLKAIVWPQNKTHQLTDLVSSFVDRVQRELSMSVPDWFQKYLAEFAAIDPNAEALRFADECARASLVARNEAWVELAHLRDVVGLLARGFENVRGATET